MRGHKVCFNGKRRKIIPVIPSYLELRRLYFCYREVWPERNEFGTPDISPEDEFMALREIFMTNLPSKFV